MSRRHSWWLAALVALTALWFGTLDYRKLVKPDEGRYAEIAREMAVSGDWLTPHLNDIKYFEKPALQYWATAAAFKIFGFHDWTARLWTALTGFFGVLLAGFAGARLFGREAGLLAAATLASSLLYLMMGHLNTLDMGLAFFLEAALVGFLLAQQGNRRWMWLAWAALALAVLSKGIVALVLTGGTLVLYSLLARDTSPWRRFEFGPGLVLFLAIAAPWFVAVSLANPEFPRFFFIHEHFERFLTTTHRRNEPWWYFIPIFLAGALPWTGMALQALPGAWRRRPEMTFQPRRFLLLWCVVIFGFFSLSGSKLPSYILPLFPALALLLGDYLTRIGRKTLVGHLTLVALVALAATLLAPRVALRADDATPLAMATGYARWLLAAGLVWFCSTVVAILLAWQARRRAALVIAAGAALLAGFGVLLGHENLAGSNSAYALAQRVKPILPPGVPFYSIRTYEQTLPYYLGRTVTLVDYQDEFEFGLAQEPEKSVPSLDEFKRRWNAAPDAFALVSPDEFDRLRAQDLPMTIVARDPRRIVIRKSSPSTPAEGESAKP